MNNYMVHCVEGSVSSVFGGASSVSSVFGVSGASVASSV